MDDTRLENNQDNTNKRPFLIRNDIKLFQHNNSTDEPNNNNNNNNNSSYKSKGLFNIDRRRSDTDALRHSLSDAKLARQKLLKYAHVKSTDSDHDVNNLIDTKNKMNNDNDDSSRDQSLEFTAPTTRTIDTNGISAAVDSANKQNAQTAKT